jgi:hypothetical protein
MSEIAKNSQRKRIRTLDKAIDLRADFESLPRGTVTRRVTDILVPLGALIVSIAFVAFGMSSGKDLNVLLGEWRTGVVVLAGAALLFSYTLWLQLGLQNRKTIEELKRLHETNDALATRIKRRLARGEVKFPTRRKAT